MRQSGSMQPAITGLWCRLQALRARRQRVGQGGGAYPAWNYTEFSVDYGSLSHHLCLGGVYVRLLLEGADQGERQGWLRVLLLRLQQTVECLRPTVP